MNATVATSTRVHPALAALGLTRETVARWLPKPEVVPLRDDRCKHSKYLSLVGLSRKAYSSELKKIHTRERVAAGLTYSGKQRTNRKWPALAGLCGKEYHREHMRQWRLGKVKGPR